jgi:cytoplasmic iron level regulating protein YaaA (DUF328/UPF0246 family)
MDDGRQRVVAALVRAMAGSEKRRAALLGMKGDALAAATAANLEVATAPTLPAIERYTGVLYGALDTASMPAARQRRIDAQVRIVSGLWGVVAPRDLIPDYKLKMSATLARLGRLSTWWRPAVTAALAPEVEGRTVWDLLPNEHRSAWAPDLAGSGAPREVVTVRFLDDVERNGRRQLVTVSHWNKLLKGALVRHVVATQLEDVDGLAAFTHPLGYVYERALTERDPDGIRVRVSFVKPA